MCGILKTFSQKDRLYSKVELELDQLGGRLFWTDRWCSAIASMLVLGVGVDELDDEDVEE